MVSWVLEGGVGVLDARAAFQGRRSKGEVGGRELWAAHAYMRWALCSKGEEL